MKTASRNRVRIIGGQWRRRLLSFPDADGLRPTADAVREKLFNWLGQDLPDWQCLDLFAGSGALGFEAASRGAAQVVMVEQNRLVCQALRENAASLNASNIMLVCADGVKWLADAPGAGFDVIFIDPPFATRSQAAILPLLPRLMKPKGYVYVEHDGTLIVPAGWTVWREGRAGRAHFNLLLWDGHA
ncbi:MAG: 16S rRNA (guanine(966)-N(2))-methyltransferase RsmD [Sulfuriferula sp.]|nr:16S rRNA (guanine(966)-N(2))-methyltransferase RsmD [Sulfuriferula sp.]